MIKIDTLKTGDIFYHAHINKVYKCTVKKEIYLFQDVFRKNPPYELIDVSVENDLDYVFSIKNEANLFFIKEDADIKREKLIKDNYEYFNNGGWIQELWHLYNSTFCESPRKENLRKVIKEKTGHDLK